MGFLERTALRLRPRLLNVAFAALFTSIAVLASATAFGTTGPWFAATVSVPTYETAAILGTVLALVVTAVTGSRAASTDGRLRALDQRIAVLREAMRPSTIRPRTAGDDVAIDLDAEIDRHIASLSRDSSDGLLELEPEGHDTLVDMPGASGPPPAGAAALLRELVRERIALRDARASVWRYVLGPVSAGIVFATIGGIMLPGADGFASGHYVLNTTLVLFAGYGLAPLVAWAVLVLALTARGAA